MPQSSIDVASRLKNKLLTPVVLSYQQTKDYNMAFEELVASIDIEEEEKEEIATIGSVTIMSTEFWDEDDEE